MKEKLFWFLKGCFNHFSRIINLTSYYFSLILPLNNNLILFESQPDFSDNSLYLYNYLKNCSTNKLEWISETKDNKHNIDKINLVHGFKPLTFYKIATAKYIFFSHSFPYFKIKKKNQTVVYLTHGCPIKKNKPKRISGTPELDYIQKSNFDVALCIGEGAVIPQAIFCMCPPEMILPLGYPRNDYLLESAKLNFINPFQQNEAEKCIIWMPTFRASKFSSLSEKRSQSDFGLPILKSYKDIEILNSTLNQYNIRLLVKIHRLQAEYPVFKQKYSNIDFITDQDLVHYDIDLYKLITKTDSLLTDYSSIYYDYMLLDKPIGFTLDDYQEYLQDRGYVFEDLKSKLAGTHIYSISDLLGYIETIYHNEDPFQERRNALKKYFHNNLEIKSSERIKNYFNL